MTNAEKFGNIFGLYATELWSMPEQDFLKWLNIDVPDKNVGDIISRQIEPLTDKEQRIFLAAMGREEKVCKQVDDECRDCREPYEDSLVRTCHEITRKVKGALWKI